MTNNTSTFFFVGKLDPFEECKDFNPGELSLGNGWILDIFQNLICIWKPDVHEHFKKVSPFVKEAFSLITLLFTFRSKIILSYRVTNWIEAKNIESKTNIIGAYISKISKRAEPRKNARINVTWKKSAKVFPKFNNSQLFRLALKDFIASLKNEGDDSFFYAYRAIENTCRAISGALNNIEKKHWDKLHKELGTNKNQIKPLTNAAKDIRHGNIDGTGLEYARSNRNLVLNISRDVLERAFKNYFPGYL